MKHSLILLLIFPRLKSKRVLSKAKNSIKQRTFQFTLVVETSPKVAVAKNNQKLRLHFNRVFQLQNDLTRTKIDLRHFNKPGIH